MDQQDIAALGEPDLTLGGLRIWVHGREFPQARDDWDGNWLRVTAWCTYPCATVGAHGSLIHLGELHGLMQGCEAMHKQPGGEAALQCMEPNLHVALKSKPLGHMDVRIAITPDHLTQTHVFEDTLDQSHLPAIVSACKALLATYPLRKN